MGSPEPLVRPARPDDAAEIARIADANGQHEEDTGRDPRYLAHLASHGRVLIAETGGRALGFAATRRLGEATMLCDLFVDPAMHGAGIGRRLLRHAFEPNSQRATFSSQDPRAMPLYASFGLAPRWPLLYLSGNPARLAEGAAGAQPRPATAQETTPQEAAAAERALTGLDRLPDYLHWAGGPDSGGLVIEREGHVIAAGACAGSRLRHLAVGRRADPVLAVFAVFAALAVFRAPTVRLCLPGPHPALGPLLRAGFRIGDLDYYMSTSEGIVSADSVPSPALG
jgi:GNAT superfamily N-acetyltransferase